MRIGVPKEIKTHEYRVGLAPASVREVIAHGHQVIVESGAGAGIGSSDAEYQAAGASTASTAQEVFAQADYGGYSTPARWTSSRSLTTT